MIRGFNTLKPFRFWCQKVLPLVYDDSLSYYELLNKVINYLNNTREDLKYFITNWSAPEVVTDYNDFTNTEKTYLYMGNQSGYQQKYWYYYDGDNWVAGGEYGSYYDLPFVTPEMFNAVGDGKTDDYVALQAMFDTKKPVIIPNKIYCTSNELIYDGDYIIGSGTIKSINARDYLLKCTSDFIVVNGINLDCNNITAIGLFCIGDNLCSIENCSIGNTDNSLLGAVSCAGIYTTRYYETIISNNRISNINRTITNPTIISSCGINCGSDGNVIIKNNLINTVKCLNETTDCDGIYVSSISALSCMANISNNIILDCTGRFIKTQIYNANIQGNRCRLINSNNDLYIKGVDFQRGGGSLIDNYFDYSDKAGSSSMFVHCDYHTNFDRNLEISGNTFVSSNEINSFLMVDGTVGGIININSNNVFTKYINYIIRASETTHYTQISYQNNNIPFYRFWNTNGTTDFQEVFLTITNNKSNYVANQVFDRPASINNIIIQNNIGIVEKLTNVTMDFNKMKSFNLVYERSGVPITNYPNALGTPDHVYLCSLNSTLFKYYDFGTGTGGDWPK